MPDGGLLTCACDEYAVAVCRGGLDVDAAADSVPTPPATLEMAREFRTPACAENTWPAHPAPGDMRLWHPPQSAGPFYRDAYVSATDVSFAAGPLGHLLVARVVEGRFERDTEGISECYRPGDVFAVSQPDRPYACRSPGVSLDLIGIGLAAVTDVTGDRTMAIPGRLRLTGYQPVSAAAARTWASTADYVTRQLADTDVTASPLVIGSAARLLAAGVLATFPNNADGDPRRADSGDDHPRTLQRAVAFIDAHADQDIAVIDIAAAASVTPRAVQLAFRRHLGTTPLAYLRRVRIERAHADLLAADHARTTVAAVAYRRGYRSPSRFTADYRQTYGITPSQALHPGQAKPGEWRARFNLPAV